MLAWLAAPTEIFAAPPQDGRFADLPDPGQLDDLGEAEAASSPPPQESETNGEDESESEVEVEAADEAEQSDETGGESEDADGEAGEPATEEPSEPPAPKVEVKVLSKPKWIKHEVIPGERLDDIAARYRIHRDSLIRWNKLDKDKPRIYSGRKLSIYTKFIPPPQQQITYTVRSGDTWAKIADAHHVDADHLRLRWNPKVPRKFKIGQELVIWIDPMEDPQLLAGDDDVATAGGTAVGTSAKAKAKLPLSSIKKGAVSVGKPNRGKIVNATRLPENTKLYTIRKPEESYGSSHALHNLQLAIANFRQDTGFDREIVIGAISKQGGGRLKPHSSHQSGRDVDIRLPVKKGITGTAAADSSEVDWDATWSLISALVATGEVQYIFLTHSLQKNLYNAGKRAGASKDMLERMIQYPNKSGTNNGIVRHAAGHTSHIHVRFNCAANETRCESY